MTTEQLVQAPSDETNQTAEYDAWFRHQVQLARDSANAGELIAAAEVEAKFAAKRAATRRRLGIAE